MKIGVVSASNVQATLIQDELKAVIERVTVFSVADVEAGMPTSTNQHVMVYDLSDASILESEELLEQMELGEPPIVFNEIDLYSMSAEQRSAWRNKTIAEIKKIAPDLASELDLAGARAVNAKTDTLVIGSSSGGPMALKEFLSNLPRLNLAIFIAQHMPDEAFGLLLRQVRDAASTWDVSIAEAGKKVAPGQVFIVPRNVVLSITSNSIIEFKPNPTEPDFHPSINQTIRSIYAYSKAKTSIAILTGMGEDGAAAVRDMKGKVNMIMAQSSSTCASSSMPDAARATGAVQVSESPRELARILSQRYDQEKAS